MSAGLAFGPWVGVALACAARNAMNSATTKTSAIDHLAIVSTNRECPQPVRTSRSGRTAQVTSAALNNGTITLNSRISVAGTGLPTWSKRRTDPTMLRVCW